MSVGKAVGEEKQLGLGTNNVPTTTASGVASGVSSAGKEKNINGERKSPGGMKHFWVRT
jgi:hypothetical protein